MPIQWDKNYSVNVKEIDDQHKYFIGLLNRLYNYIYTNKSQADLKNILTDLVAYKTKHFATEEKYFDLYHYENTVEHKAEHRKLEEQVSNFQKDCEAGIKDITVELVDFLEDWLVDHLNNQDKKYIQCFNENGLY